MRRYTIYLITCFFTIAGFTQNGMDLVMKEVNVNNRSIQANQKYWQAKQAEHKTNLNPVNPFVEYDYMIGSPAGAGSQRDFAITQRLDFPTVYKRRKELASQLGVQTEFQQQVYRQDILLEAKLSVLQIIYLNKKSAELNRRLIQTQNLVINYQDKVEKGEVIILDLNKARIQLLQIKNETAMNENEKQQLLTRIAALNGGISVSVLDTVYPVISIIPDFETLDSIIESNDPILKVYEQEKQILKQKWNLQKALNLPQIEAGYHSQGILGQRYRGIHAGLTIPLWENKNKLNAINAILDYETANAGAHRLTHRFENLQLYDQLEVRLNLLKEYQTLLPTLNNGFLLNKALALGQITSLQYFYEESFYYNTYDLYLQAEWQYHQAVARLFKYEL